jgi:FKBP-type peptidyl-prolyl cis-trans isomerase FklB
MKYTPIMAVIGVVLLTSICTADEKTELKTENDKVNYSVGHQIGGDFKRQEVELNPQALVQGIEDALEGSEPLMTTDEMRTTLVDLKKRIMVLQREKAAQATMQNLKAAEDFLAKNATNEGVKTLPSGLQYKVMNEGSGTTPGATDKVTVHYRGTLTDGTEFDSSYSRNKPASFGVNRVIPGWTEALQLMQEGDKWQLFIPPKLGYAERGAGSKIPPNSALIFEVELLSINRD